MSSETKHFTVLSKSVLADLSAAKSETSQRFLKPRPMAAAAFAARAAAGRMFRPTAVATPTQNVVGVGIDEKVVGGVASGVPCIKFLVKQIRMIHGLGQAARE